MVQVDPTAPNGHADFSLVVGGPLYGLLLRVGLVEPPLRRLRLRMLVFVALTWVPLLVRTMIDGTAVDGVTIPFLYDIETYARFVVALPLLVYADVVLHRRLGAAVVQFGRTDLVPRASSLQFEASIASAIGLRGSVVAEVTILLIAFMAAWFMWRYAPALPASTWYADVNGGRVNLTIAGKWFVHVAAPLSQFLLMRMYFRLFIWGRFLWQVSRLRLRLTPSHPDRAGGLGFLQESVVGFVPLLLAQAFIASGFVASRVLFTGRNVLDFRMEAIALAVMMLLAVLLPLCLFIAQLVQTRQSALNDYGELASTYMRQFESRWIQRSDPPDAPLLGNADVQSLADMGSSYDLVRGMRLVPIDSRAVIVLLLAIGIPFLPLVFTVISLPELLSRLAQVMF